ncbi:MAG TPA: sigma-54 dependent transcriptional regulator [Planctomycetaceae bacterium]
MARILLIDDDSELSGFLKCALEKDGHHVDCLEDARGAPELLLRSDYDVVLLDNKLPGISGIEFLATLEQHAISVPVILMTGDPTSETAIQAINLGAFDYIVKPLESDDFIDELEPLIARATALVRSTKEHVRLPGDTAPGDGKQLLGNSRPMQDVYKLIGKVAGSDVPVLIRGENGTGKDLVAQAIHSHSPRGNKPFVAMNCAALNENLLDDELFGHEPRSFSGAGEKLRKGRFEHAHGGTLFLDEIGDMPPMLQAKLLRVLENREIVRVGGNEPIHVDVRIVSATNRDLDARVRTGEFREDLLFRLNWMTIHLPSLRQRGPEDIKLLVEHFLNHAAQNSVRPHLSIQPEAWSRLYEYPWPGNVRELQSVVRRAVLISRGSQITSADLELKPSCPEGAPGGMASDDELDAGDVATHITRAVKAALVSGDANLNQSLHNLVDEVSLRLVLAECGGNQVKAASRLGISRNGLRAKMRTYGLE